jgi:amino acid adenylation domain-containing protein
MIYLLAQIVDSTAERYPDKEAFRFYDQSLTYAELVQRSNSLARLLVELGVKRGDRVGVFLHKSLETAVAVYGIMKAGAAYVPLDPLTPLPRLAQILESCEIRQLVTQPQKRTVLAELSRMDNELDYVIGLNPLPDVSLPTISWDEVFKEPDISPAYEGITEQDMAYIIFTSGSTGEPKGMIHTHHSGLSYAKMAANVYDVGPEDQLGNFAPLHFDQSTFEYFSGPLVGATTIIIPEEYAKFPASLSKLMAAEKLTFWYSVPFALIQLLLRGVLHERDLSSLRWILFGGEPFPTKHLRALMKLLPQARFSNIYGPAEVNQCTYYHVPPLAEGYDEPIPIGRIWDNAEGLVVDNNDLAVPQGEVGELLVRTPTMMSGYWKQSGLNEQAFFYRAKPGGRPDVFYRTGDLVQLQVDGYYRFLGRKDRQIKVRGYRIELDEVEAVLSGHPQIEEAAVFVVSNDDGVQQIEARIIRKSGATVTESHILEYLQKYLPRYALPATIESVGEFPRTSTGKIDRRALTMQVLTERKGQEPI